MGIPRLVGYERIIVLIPVILAELEIYMGIEYFTFHNPTERTEDAVQTGECRIVFRDLSFPDSGIFGFAVLVSV